MSTISWRFRWQFWILRSNFCDFFAMGSGDEHSVEARHEDSSRTGGRDEFDALFKN